MLLRMGYSKTLAAIEVSRYFQFTYCFEKYVCVALIPAEFKSVFNQLFSYAFASGLRFEEEKA